MSGNNEWGYPLFWTSVCVVAFFWSDVWYSKLAYELYYSVDSVHLAIDKKPHDCDFWKAPLGEKECHYKRVVGVTEVGISATTHVPVISYDRGKTWSYYTPDPGRTVPQNATVTSVSVTWEKIED